MKIINNSTTIFPFNFDEPCKIIHYNAEGVINETVTPWSLGTPIEYKSAESPEERMDPVYSALRGDRDTAVPLFAASP